MLDLTDDERRVLAKAITKEDLTFIGENEAELSAGRYVVLYNDGTGSEVVGNDSAKGIITMIKRSTGNEGLIIDDYCSMLMGWFTNLLLKWIHFHLFKHSKGNEREKKLKHKWYVSININKNIDFKMQRHVYVICKIDTLKDEQDKIC